LALLYSDKNSAWSVNDVIKKFYRVGPWRDGCDEVFAQVHLVQTLDVAEGIHWKLTLSLKLDVWVGS